MRRNRNDRLALEFSDKSFDEVAELFLAWVEDRNDVHLTSMPDSVLTIRSATQQALIYDETYLTTVYVGVGGASFRTLLVDRFGEDIVASACERDTNGDRTLARLMKTCHRTGISLE